MPKKKAKGKKKKGGVSVDLSGVESGGAKKIPEGQYVVEIVGFEEKENNAGDGTYLNWTTQVVDDKKHNGTRLYYITSLKPNALWNLRNWLEALGVEIPDSEMDLVTEEFEGLRLGVEVEDDRYEGKTRSKISDFFPEDGGSDDDDEEEDDDDDDTEVEDDDDEEGVSEEELDEMDRDELVEVIEKYELDINPKKHKKTSKLLKVVKEALEEAGHLSEDDDDEEDED